MGEDRTNEKGVSCPVPEGYREVHTLTGLPPETPILLALSGGEDSVVLLSLLADYAKRYGTPVHVAHVDHGIRGAEAERDCAFCMQLANHYGFRISTLHVRIPDICRESGEGLEEAARRVRYDWFAELMKKHEIPILAVAHHASDQAETVLLHMSRGTGLRGLCGMAAARPFGDGWLVRPLLGCAKEEIRAYRASRGLAFVTDSTNADENYTRNRLRGQVMPVMRSVNPRFEAAVGQMTAALSADADFLEASASSAYETCVTADKNAVWAQKQALSALHPALLRRVLMRMAHKAGCAHTEAVHIEALCRMTKDARTGQRLSLPDGVRAALLPGGRLCFSVEMPSGADCESLAEQVAVPCFDQTHGEVAFGGYVFSWSDAAKKKLSDENRADGQNVYNLSKIAEINSAKIVGEPFLRVMGEGDRLLLRGMHRRVRKLFGAAGVPVAVRQRLPLLCDAAGLLWVPGIGQRDGTCPADGACGFDTGESGRRVIRFCLTAGMNEENYSLADFQIEHTGERGI